MSFDADSATVHTPQLRKRGLPLFDDEPLTIPALFLNAVNNLSRPDAFCYKRDGQWRQISSAEALERISNIAAGLYSLGLRKGDKAAILAANSPDWTFADAGCQFAGIVDVPIYTTLSENSVEYILKDAGPKVFFLENRATYERIRAAIGECKTIEHLIFFGLEKPDGENAISLADLENSGKKTRSVEPKLLDGLTRQIKSDEVRERGTKRRECKRMLRPAALSRLTC